MTDLLLLCLAGALALVHLVTCLVVLCRRGRRGDPGPRAATVTVLRPVCGCDPFDPVTLESTFWLDWPRLDLIFCAARSDDPAVPLLRGLMARYPKVRARLLIGDDRLTGNPKLDNLAKGWRAATGDRVVMADANLLLPRDYIDRLMAVDGPEVGLVSSPPIGTQASGFWAEVEAAFLNGNQARLQLFADEAGFAFAQGKTLMWSRAFLDARGGIPALGRNLAEDVAATRIVRAAGRRVRLTAEPFAQPIGKRDRAAVWARQLRWSRVRRDGFPDLFLTEPLNGAVVPLVMAGLGGGPLAVAVLATLFYGSEYALCRAMGWPVRPLTLPAMILRDGLIPLIWLATFRQRGIVWRGTAMTPTDAPAQMPQPAARAEPAAPLPAGQP